MEQLGGIFIDVVHGDYENVHSILVFSDRSCENRRQILVSSDESYENRHAILVFSDESCENQYPIFVFSDKKREPDIGSHFSFQVSTQTVSILMIFPDFLYIRNLL